MRIGLAADHAGFELKRELAIFLQELGHAVIDFGAVTPDPKDDYPEFAASLAEAVAKGGVERGVIICGSGVGACITANKVPGVRACVCHDTYSVRQGVQHDDMNVLTLGARVIGPELACELLYNFLNAAFVPAERHLRRLSQLKTLENRYSLSK